MALSTSLAPLLLGWPWDKPAPTPAPEPEPQSFLEVTLLSVLFCWALPYVLLQLLDSPEAEDRVRRMSDAVARAPGSLVRSASGKLMMPKGGKIYRAVCELQAGMSAKGVSGRVELIQVEGVGWTTITYDVRGLKPGSHGFHINELADFSDSSLAGAGPIYNPFGKAHGGPGDLERKVGDLGNIVADKKGVAKGEMVDHLVKLSGKTSVIGRSVIVHADADDLGKGDNSKADLKPPQNGFVSLVTGNAGGRLAGGEIKSLPVM